MKTRASRAFWRHFERLPRDAQAAARTAFETWKINPWHPSLHFKRVGNVTPTWSARIDRNMRALAERMPDGTFVWFWIGPHDEYERLLGGADD